jgi:hypothetical protein
MKRNEKILVYGVTGFLLAILVVAVVFGNEDLTRAVEARDKQERPRTIDEILIAGLGDEAARDPVGELGVEGEQETDLTLQAQVPATIDGAGQPVQEAVDPMEFVGPLPLVAQPSAAVVVTALGKSRRERDYRIVEIQSQDTFHELVLRWTGSSDYQARVERLNEGLATSALTAGEELWLPWVDDDVLWEAHEAREEAQQRQTEMRARAEPRLYTLKRGDSLWKLAEGAAGLGGAPAYVERIKALNPNITDFDRLQEGQQIRLPAVR